MADTIEEFFADIEDGPLWITGAFFKKLGQVLMLDRARAGVNLDELPSPKGRFFNAKAAGAPASSLDPLTVVTAIDAAHPGRVRVVTGLIGDLLPDEMNIPDGILPNGTDNQCYLTMGAGTNYIYGKVLVDSATGLYTGADVYVVTSTEEADGTYCYLLIAVVTNTAGALSIYQAATGNQSLATFCSADGTILTPVWSSQG